MFMCLQLMKIYLTYHINPNSAAIAIARVKHDGSGVELQGLFLTVYCTARFEIPEKFLPVVGPEYSNDCRIYVASMSHLRLLN